MEKNTADLKMAGRLPYEAPRIATSEAFERLALACNGNAIPGPCKAGAEPTCTPSPRSGPLCNSIGAS